MSRTVAHVYKKPNVPLSVKYAGFDWVINNRWSYFFCDVEDLAKATNRHIYRYRRNAGDRSVKESPRYLKKSIAPHDYERVAYDRGTRVTVLTAKRHRSNRVKDRVGARNAVRLASDPDADLTECFDGHWHRHSALYDI